MDPGRHGKPLSENILGFSRRDKSDILRRESPEYLMANQFFSLAD